MASGDIIMKWSMDHCAHLIYFMLIVDIFEFRLGLLERVIL
jgi:hypothetical protein